MRFSTVDDRILNKMFERLFKVVSILESLFSDSVYRSQVYQLILINLFIY